MLENLSMGNSSINILLIDPNSNEENIIRDILINSSLNVQLVENEEDALKSIENFSPGIVLYRVSNKNIKDYDKPGRACKLLSKSNIPFVIISSGADIDYYLRGLENGIYYNISTPISIEFLNSRIKEIIRSDNISGKDKSPLRIEFIYNKKSYLLDINQSQLVNFIHSVLSNSIHQSHILSDMLSGEEILKKSLKKKKKSLEIFKWEEISTSKDPKTEKELYRALENNEFKLYYQPIISLGEDKISGFEALIRWEHPERGIIPPDKFIPVAEESALVIPIGFWVIEEAVKQLNYWENKYRPDFPLKVSINLSANQFIHPGLSERISEIVEDNDINPENIGFEITESVFMDDMEAANIQLLKLKSNNHILYMDDFGTGYSSLTYLLRFPVDILKIDKSFVQWMHVDEQSEEIVRSVVSLAHNLKMKVVAEGVEEEVHFQRLKGLGCDYAQGYFFSKPLEAESADEFIKRHL